MRHCDSTEKIRRVKLLLGSDKLKEERSGIERIIKSAGLKITPKSAQAGIVIGGDGAFGLYGGIEKLPLLFVGKKSPSKLGSKALMAEVYMDNISGALDALIKGTYAIDRQQKLGVSVNGVRKGEVFTDVYMQRGAESNALRYEVHAYGNGIEIREFAISDGVVISTHAGATGYFSYPNKIVFRDLFDSKNFGRIGRNEIGVCHILPTYIHRDGAGAGMQPLRYRIPIGTTVDIMLKREADARLYGIGDKREGIQIGLGCIVSVRADGSYARLIKLPPQP
ncbi:MAG: hypothetical protein QXR58_01275 [Candidatus Micrarchaeaceae archaeon]